MNLTSTPESEVIPPPRHSNHSSQPSSPPQTEQHPAINESQAQETLIPSTPTPNASQRQEQALATNAARHKFVMGLYRIHTLCVLYPSVSTQLQRFRECVEELGVDSPSSQTEAEVKVGNDGEGRIKGDGEVDVERTRVWKFRALDLMIEMLMHELKDGEVVDVCAYAEKVMRGFREKMGGPGAE